MPSAIGSWWLRPGHAHCDQELAVEVARKEEDGKWSKEKEKEEKSSDQINLKKMIV